MKSRGKLSFLGACEAEDRLYIAAYRARAAQQPLNNPQQVIPPPVTTETTETDPTEKTRLAHRM